MFDKSYIYKKDYENNRKKFDNQNFQEFYDSVYVNGRLNSDKDQNDTKNLLNSYNKNLNLIGDLVRDNYRLQHQVHQLGIKNRIKKKLRRYKPPESVRSYVTESELNEILDGSYELSRRIPEISLNNSIASNFKKEFQQDFESELIELQKTLELNKFENEPLVSIIVPTRDGLEHLKRLFDANFIDNACYENIEIIIVDNDSKDKSVEFINSLKYPIDIRIIKNKVNKSFSESNNQAAKIANGDFLLLLNNDVYPVYGWLNHMMKTMLNNKSVGAVGSKLIYPYKNNFTNSYRIQHGGIGLKLEENFIRPINLNMGGNLLENNVTPEEEKLAVTAACLLVEKDKYNEVGGFTEEYWYGYEDVDFCLKLNDYGYINIVCNKSVLYHYEFGTQDKIDSSKLSKNRLKNIETFKNRWQAKLFTKYWDSLLNGSNYATDKTLHVCFITTESRDTTAAGDYFTAKELALSLEKLNIKTSFIGVRNTPKPYQISEDVDVVISMIDGYDISKIDRKSVTKIAWTRNWFERWAEKEYFRDFDIVLCNSEKAQEMYKNEHYIDSHLFKIATNYERFSEIKTSKDELLRYASDITFTGNYWHDPRDITKLFNPKKYSNKYEIKIYGKDWNHVPEFAPFHQGFINYKDIPKVYHSGKILIDDATWIVNEWGSVNSRVFDGLAAGVLVITNGIDGSTNTFEGNLPTFSSSEELEKLLEKYLSSPKKRISKVNELKQYVLKNHTYDIRASQLIDILTKTNTRNTIDLKLPIPNWSEAKEWGDLHFGLGLKKSFEKNGYNVKLQVLSKWENNSFSCSALVLRGLSTYKIKKIQTNIMWNISHPDKVPLDEYKLYDYVFVASSKHAKTLINKGVKHVHTLEQCFDESVFNKNNVLKDNKYKSDILYVGNTRNVFRKSVKYLMNYKNLDKQEVKIFGKNWNSFVDSKYISGNHIPNSEVPNYYGNTKILLNDHWDDMNEYGFVSNRLFDASALGSFVISDNNIGIEEIFGPGVIQTYKDESEMHSLLDKYLKDDMLRNKLAKKAQSIVVKKHTFDNRTNYIIEVVKELQN